MQHWRALQVRDDGEVLAGGAGDRDDSGSSSTTKLVLIGRGRPWGGASRFPAHAPDASRILPRPPAIFHCRIGFDHALREGPRGTRRGPSYALARIGRFLDGRFKGLRAP